MADNNTIGGQHYEMMRRCYNPKSISYKDYGAKGIKVCPEWHDREVFRKWCVENGYKKGLRINRKDSTLDYTPDNCFLGEVNKAKHGKNEAIRKSIKENKAKKAKIGLKRLADSPLYGTYIAMHDRCENPTRKAYRFYGARGISVCPEWSGKDGIYNFLEWMQKQGWHPGLTIDRIDNNKGYSPDNCRLATMQEQLRNRRNIKLYDYKGMSLTIKEIATLEKISDGKLRYRIDKKQMPLDEAIAECRKG
jgi:hypothetical protein